MKKESFYLPLLFFFLQASSAAAQAPTSRPAPAPRWLRLAPLAPSAQPSPSLPTKQAATTTPQRAATPPHPQGIAPQQRPLPAQMQPATKQKPKEQTNPDEEEKIPLTDAQLRRFHQLTQLIIAPCCWVQSVSMHPSKMSTLIKNDLKKRLAAGHTDEQIKAAYLKRFGERVFAIPPHQDIFWLPIVGAAAAFFIAIVLIIVWSSRGRKDLAES